MQTAANETETLAVVTACYVNDDDAATWPDAESHESFLAEPCSASADTVAAQ